MKIRLEQDELADAVSWAARTLPARPATPVLAGVRLAGEGDTVQLSAFDLEVSAKAQVPAIIDEPGVVVVSGRLLAEIAKALPNEPVEMGLEGNRVSVRCGRSSFALPTLPVEDYPQLPDLPPDAGSVPATDFARAVAQVSVAASRDDTLPMLTGISLELKDDTITLAATDRYRLAVRELKWHPNGPVEGSALVKARQLAELGRTLSHSDTVRIALGASDDGRIGFSVTGRELVTRLLHGDFPKYRSLLPTESSTKVTVDCAALMEAVKRVKLVAAERTAPIRLLFSDGEVLLRAGAFDDASANESLEASIDGDSIEIAFNPDYLFDGLNALGSDEVRLSFTLPTKPAVLAPNADSSYRYLLMPVRLGTESVPAGVPAVARPRQAEPGVPHSRSGTPSPAGT